MSEDNSGHMHYFALVALVAVVAVISLVLSMRAPSLSEDLTGNAFRWFIPTPTPPSLPAEEEAVPPEEEATEEEVAGEPVSDQDAISLTAVGCKQFIRPYWPSQLVTGKQFCGIKHYQSCVGGSFWGTAWLQDGSSRSFHVPLNCNSADTPAAGPSSNMEQYAKNLIKDDPQILGYWKGGDMTDGQLADVDVETVVMCCSST